MRRLMLVLLAGIVAVPSLPSAVSHGATDHLDDPEGDFAKKPAWNEDRRWDRSPIYAGAPCPLTDILSVEAQAVHEADNPSLPGNSTLVEIRFSNLTTDNRVCPMYGEGSLPTLFYQFRVRPANHEEARVWWKFEPDLDSPIWSWVTWRDDGLRGSLCRSCASLDLAEDKITLALPMAVAEPPYRHANVFAVSSPCGPVPVDQPDPPGIHDLSVRCSPVMDHQRQTGGHVDVVPNLGEGEWSLYTDEADDPKDRLIPSSFGD